MSKLEELFSDFAKSYKEEREGAFSKTQAVKILTDDIPNEINTSIDRRDDIKIYGSAGTGNWAEIPWVAILNKKITTSTQMGYYVVFLFDKELNNVYLCLG